ncbi:MAG: hypothetical protein P1V97_08960, partial [Planctomycetota bacterium]|nr:hypothetical protein [Planctomycetota bacterium]
LFVLSASTQLDDDFNRALRARDQLSAQGLAWLYLACKRSKRSYNTAALIENLKSTVTSKGEQAFWVGSRRRGWTHESSEASAWAAYALLTAEPDSILVEKVANTLMARQKNGYWRSTKETAAVLFFLSALIEKDGLSKLNGSMSVEINGKPFAQTKLEGKFLRQRDVELTIPGKLLKTGRNTLRLVKTGPGKVNYSLSLKYVEKADSLKNKGPLLSFDRRYRRFIRGASSYDIPGWSIVRASARPSLASRPSLLETVSGQRLWVDLVVKTRESLPYVMIEDMLPAGCEIIKGKETGNFQRFEARDDRAVFFVTNLSSGTHRLRYMIQAVTPGEFAVLPAQGGPMYEPEVFAHGASAVLTIHDDAKSLKKAEELTPDELFAKAKRYQAKQQDQKAIMVFKRIREKYKLQSSYDEDILARLLQLAVRQREANLTVTSYEALKDLNPRRVNRLDKKTLTHLVVAYNVVGEFQRSHNLGRKVLLRYFEEEAQLASVYRQLGRPLPAQNYMRDLLIRYPESNSIKEQWFNLASRYLSISQPIKKGSAVTMPMYTTAYQAFKDYCALFPDSPLAAQAQLNAAEALQKLRDFKGADREASFVLERHNNSRIREKALILLLRSRYARKQWDGTFEAGQGLLKLRHKNGSGYYSKSPFVPEVHYTFAKIYHVQGKLAKAVEYYKLCRNKFTDAADNYQYFTETGIEIPDNVTAEPGKQAKLTLRSKNLGEMKLRVYPVDFMTLFLTRKNLHNIHQVKLTGIKPVLSKTYSLAKGAKFAWADHTIDLPMKKTGVYLVVAKSGDFDRSSLVVISDLKIKVQADGSGVRVYASKNGKPCEGARVRVTDGSSLVLSGKTDARGVFHPQGRYRVSVRAIVVEYKGHYAIYRR